MLSVTGLDVLVAVAIAVGLVGILVPLLPGALLVLAAMLVWAIDVSETTGWVVFGLAAAVIAVGQVVKYTVPGKRLKAGGIPNRSLLFGGVLGIVGFFVVPVVGLLIGFPLGIYLAERARLGPAGAWPSTKAALRAVGVSILIELASALVATAIWVGGVVAT